MNRHRDDILLTTSRDNIIIKCTRSKDNIIVTTLGRYYIVK